MSDRQDLLDRIEDMEDAHDEEVWQHKKEIKELIEKFLEDWNKVWVVKPIESAYTHYCITEERYKAIKEKWGKELNER